MVVNKKYSSFFGVLIVASIIGGAFYFYLRSKNDFTSKLAQTEAMASKESSLKKRLLESYSRRIEFIEYLLTRNAKGLENEQESMKAPLQLLQKAMSADNIDFSDVERLQIPLNQILAIQIVYFRQSKLGKNNKTSPISIFQNENEIKNLERLDRAVDLSRNQYSDWSFEYWSQKEKLASSYWAKKNPDYLKSKLKDVSYFPVDHLMRQKSIPAKN